MKLLYLLLSSLWSFRGGQLQCTCPVRWFSSLEIQLSRIKVLKQFNSKAQWGNYMYCSLYGGKCVLESLGGASLCLYVVIVFILSLKCSCWWNRSRLSINQGRKCFLFNVLVDVWTFGFAWWSVEIWGNCIFHHCFPIMILEILSIIQANYYAY